jgi:predicted Zn-dependent protease
LTRTGFRIIFKKNKQKALIMKNIAAYILILISALIIVSCSPEEGARDQINQENSTFKDPIYNTVFKLYYEKKYDEAYSMLKNYVLEKQGKSLILHSLFVKCAEKSGKLDQTMKLYQSLPHQKYYIFAKGVMLILENRSSKEAKYSLKKCLYFFPQNPVVKMYLGYVYVLRNKANLGEKLLSEAASAISSYPLVWYYLALSRYHTGNKEGALLSINKALETSPAYMKSEIDAISKLKKKIK